MSCDLFQQIIYSTASYRRNAKQVAKRDNSHSCYVDSSNNSHCFGVIELFTSAPKPCVLLCLLHRTQQTLLQSAGHPCREVLKQYKQVDLLSSYMVLVDPTIHSPLVPITFDDKVLSVFFYLCWVIIIVLCSQCLSIIKWHYTKKDLWVLVRITATMALPID